jgi:hypothetical protein
VADAHASALVVALRRHAPRSRRALLFGRLLGVLGDGAGSGGSSSGTHGGGGGSSGGSGSTCGATPSASTNGPAAGPAADVLVHYWAWLQAECGPLRSEATEGCSQVRA